MKKQDMKAIGTAIRLHRMKRRLTIDNLAEVLELSSSYIGLVERGDRCMSTKNLFKLCDLFCVTPNQLLPLDEDRYSDSGSNNVTEQIHVVTSLLRKLNSSEKDFVIESIKNLRKIER